MNARKKSLKAAIYARKSFDDKEESESISVQLEHCRELAKKEGYQVIAEFHENQSGRTPPKGYEHIFDHDIVTQQAIKRQRHKDRPKFGELCMLIEQNEVDLIICRDTTRIARPKAMSTLINWIPQLLKQHKVDIHSVQEGFQAR